jgi:dipeptidase E
MPDFSNKISMKLFLASRFNHPNTIKKLNEYVGGLKDKKIAYIPTASNGENDWGYWERKEKSSWKDINSICDNVKPILLEKFRNETVIKELEGQDIIWFAGGMPGYLMYWIKRCKLDLHIRELLHKGALYVGSSAGSMAAGKTLDISTWGFVDSERGAEKIEPMNLVDFDIYPHFEDQLLPKIKENYKGKKLYLLKDGEEIIVEDGKVTIIGEERVITN